MSTGQKPKLAADSLKKLKPSGFRWSQEVGGLTSLYDIIHRYYNNNTPLIINKINKTSLSKEEDVITSLGAAQFTPVDALISSCFADAVHRQPRSVTAAQPQSLHL